MVLIKRAVPVVEIGLVLVLFLYIRKWLIVADFGDWQESLFGRPLISSILLFFLLPLVFVALSGREPGSIGLATDRLKYHGSVALRAIGFVLPATALFPIIGMLGTNHREWLGASILSFGFILAGTLFASKSQDLENSPQADLSWKGLACYVALLVASLILIAILQPFVPLAARIVAVVVFVGFLEEIFFRGYIQSRLNESFGRPFRFRGVRFGAGLFVAAMIFGLFHPITVENETPWAWGLWTTAGGLVFGFLREKTGAILSPALLHGAIWIPGVLFGPA